jgi:hypothetical protein
MPGVMRIRQALAARSEKPGDGRAAAATRSGPGGAYLVLVAVLAAAYFVPRGISWNADTHIFLTASIVDRGTLNIDPLAQYTGDVASANGHFYADKAPGLSLAAIPVYIVLKYTLLGGKPYTSLFAVAPAHRLDFLIRYLLALIFGAIPTGLIALLLFRFVLRLGAGRRWSAALALTYILGTIARAFADQFFSHQLAALLVFSGFVLLYRIRHEELAPRYAALAGALLGYGVITEYPTALIAAALGVYALLPREATTGLRGLLRTANTRLGLLLAVGAAPFLLLGALYNTLAFGGPLSQGYTHLAGPESFRVGQAQGFMGITYPHLDAIWQTTLGPYRGLFLISPVLLLAVPGFVMLWRRLEWRAETRLWLVIVLVYALFVVSYYAWDGGFSLGPRHFLPALPFLMLPLAEVVRPVHDRRWRIATAILAACSIVIVELAVAAGPLADPRYASPLTEWTLPLLLAGRLDNNWGMLLRLPGLLQLLPLVAVLGLVIWRGWRKDRSSATVSMSG